jgi:soluble lytic murein transglycosylase-like protein
VAAAHAASHASRARQWRARARSCRGVGGAAAAFGALADAADAKNGLPRGLMRAVVTVESGNHAHRISFAGAMGPAQLMPGTAALLGVSDPFDPSQAIDGGARYLAQHLRRTGRVDLAVAAYNAGPGAVNGSVPRNGETELYVAKVMKELHR